MSMSRRRLFGIVGSVAAAVAAVALVSPVFAKGTTPKPPSTPKPPPTKPPPEPKPKDLIETLTASTDPTFKTLLDALKAADLTTTLKGKGPFTLFAATDDAFKKMDADKLADLMKPANKAHLKAVLDYSVADKKLMSADILKLKEIKTANGASLTVKLSDDKMSWSVDDLTPSKMDVAASNGVIHFMGAVLLPKEPEPPANPPAMK
jgi:uncharacterized surface protein with fasciclin (FAS1) repeats